MIAVHQVLHISLKYDDFFDRTIARDTRGHPWRLTKTQAVTRIRRNTFSVRVISDWNRLPPSVVGADSLNQFKSSLDSHWAQLQFMSPIPHEPSVVLAKQLDWTGPYRLSEPPQNLSTCK